VRGFAILALMDEFKPRDIYPRVKLGWNKGINGTYHQDLRNSPKLID